jgi:hypothetical protein
MVFSSTLATEGFKIFAPRCILAICTNKIALKHAHCYKTAKGRSFSAVAQLDWKGRFVNPQVRASLAAQLLFQEARKVRPFAILQQRGIKKA